MNLLDEIKSGKKKLTCILAHADDEFLFGWPVIKYAKKLICCTDDKTHPTRQWCKRRSEAFADIGKLLGAETVCLRHDSGFSKKEHKEFVSFAKEVQSLIENEDVIFTDNGWGSYGHLDHIFLHQLVRMSGKPMLTTDIVLKADWYDVKPYSQGKGLGYFKNDPVFHEQCMKIYRSYGAMGWTVPMVEGCNLIEIQ